MYTMLIYGIMLGIAATLMVQEIHASIERYKDRKQAEFEAAVAAATAHRKAQALRNSSEWNNVRTFAFNDDPFADV
jgi:hypothetical protein